MSESKPISFVTGATGFLGHHLCAQLIEAGHEVHALVRDPGSEAAQRLPESVVLITGNILDAEGLPAAVKASKASWFFHCAGMVSRDADDAVAMHEANVIGTQVVLRAARSSGVRRFVHASTSGTIGISTDEDHVASETDPTPRELINRWPYYRTKLYAEQCVLDAAQEGFEVMIVNPSLLLGPGDLNASSTEDVRRFLEQRVPVSPSGGYSFVDARDAASGMIGAAQQGRSKERYLLTACNCTVRTFFNRVARVAGMSPPLISLPANATAKKWTLSLVRAAHKWIGEDEAVPDPASIDMAQHYWYVDASKAERELEWSSRDAMVTLADTVADLRDRGLVMMAPPK